MFITCLTTKLGKKAIRNYWNEKWLQWKSASVLTTHHNCGGSQLRGKRTIIGVEKRPLDRRGENVRNSLRGRSVPVSFVVTITESQWCYESGQTSSFGVLMTFSENGKVRSDFGPSFTLILRHSTVYLRLLFRRFRLPSQLFTFL